MYDKFQHMEIKYAVITLIILSFFSILSLLTPLAIIFLLLVPLPLAIVYHKINYKTYFGLLFITGFLYILLFGIFIGFFICLYVLGLGTLYGYLTHKNKPAFNTIKTGSIVMILLFTFLIFGLQIVFNINFLEETYITLEETVETQVNYLEKAGAPASQIEEIEGIPELYSEYMLPLIPSGLILSAVIIATLHYLMAYKVLNLLGESITSLRPFKYWTFPRYLSLVFILSFLAFLIIGDGDSLYGVFSNNLFNILTYAVLLQGASLVYWFLREKNFGKIISVAGLFLLLIIPPLNLVFLFSGILDLTFNFRKI